MILPDGVWYTKVRAQNDAGWSEFSEIAETSVGTQCKNIVIIYMQRIVFYFIVFTANTEKHTSDAGSLTVVTGLLCLSTAFVAFFQ